MALRCTTLTVFVALILSTSLPANAQSDQWFKKSVITLQDLSEIPGMVLEPGTYVLKTEDGATNPRATVQLLNQNESQILATFLATPDHRQRPESDAVFTYFESITDGPKPIQSWFYPGEMNGYEFVYPKPRAKEIAKHTEDHVMASETKNSAIVAITQSGAEVPIYDAITKAKVIATADARREKPQPAAVPQQPVKKPKRNREQ